MKPFTNKASRELSHRTVHAKLYPTARTFPQRREVLRVLESYGEVVMFRSLKYHPTTPIPNAFLCLFAKSDSAEAAINASPVRYALLSSPAINVPKSRLYQPDIPDPSFVPLQSESITPSIPQTAESTIAESQIPERASIEALNLSSGIPERKPLELSFSASGIPARGQAELAATPIEPTPTEDVKSSIAPEVTSIPSSIPESPEIPARQTLETTSIPIKPTPSEDPISFLAQEPPSILTSSPAIPERQPLEPSYIPPNPTPSDSPTPSPTPDPVLSSPSEIQEPTPSPPSPSSQPTELPFELHISKPYFDHLLHLTSPFTNLLHGPFKPVSVRNSFISSSLSTVLPSSILSEGLRDWESDRLAMRNDELVDRQGRGGSDPDAELGGSGVEGLGEEGSGKGEGKEDADLEKGEEDNEKEDKVGGEDATIVGGERIRGVKWMVHKRRVRRKMKELPEVMWGLQGLRKRIKGGKGDGDEGKGKGNLEWVGEEMGDGGWRVRGEEVAREWFGDVEEEGKEKN